MKLAVGPIEVYPFSMIFGMERNLPYAVSVMSYVTKLNQNAKIKCKSA